MIGTNNVKAQFWSFDVIFAMVIFVLALTLLGYTWYNINNQLSLSYGGGAVIAQLQVHSLAQELLSQGYPTGWTSIVNTTNTLTWNNMSIGLTTSSSSTTLSPQKLYAFMSMANANYQATKQVLGVGYDYYIIISSGGVNMTIGSNPNANGALSVYVEKRNIFFGGSPATMTVELWTNTALAVT